MSQKASDVAAIASVVANVLKKNALLRSRINEQWWTSSSIRRTVGHSRQGTADLPEDDLYVLRKEQAASNALRKRKDIVKSSREEVVRPQRQPLQTDQRNDDVFVLRRARDSSLRQSGFVQHGSGESSSHDELRSNQQPGPMNQPSRVSVPDQPDASAEPTAEIPQSAFELTSTLSASTVPSSRLSRLYHYTTLGSSLAFNSLSDRLLGGNGSSVLSPRNVDLLVRKLSRMRGAALKLGQMISFQEDSLPEPVKEVMRRVQDSADYMPGWQLDAVMSREFGAAWRDKFATFDEIPIAAASIGQVHKACLHDKREVAVKVQYPGVAESISSDLKNLGILLKATKLLPRGLFLDKTIANARTELAWECDYEREAENTRRFRELVGTDQTDFLVPEVIDELSGKQVLTTEFLHGKGIAKVLDLPQKTRDHLGSALMTLCLRELAEFNFMQTDPNWTNFLYNQKTGRIELLDFGASRAFDRDFIDRYCRLLVAAARGDRATLVQLSQELGYLTGGESEEMIEAHLSSILTLAEPFSFQLSRDAVYDFEGQTVTERVKKYIPTMLRQRLAPPPEETYSLHRRLSGHFLLCAKLRSRIECRRIFEDVMARAGYV
ncbi:hypothetical protein PYCC9005_003768 [Savitreella phatthalungensis]